MSKWMPVLVRVDSSGYGEATEMVGAARYVPEAAPVRAALDQRPNWSLSNLQRLASSQTATGQRWARALDVCSECPGEYLPTSEVARRSGMEINEWRDAPRKISRHLKAHYPDLPTDSAGHAYWPLHAQTVPEHPQEVSWAASSGTARLWKQVRGAGS